MGIFNEFIQANYNSFSRTAFFKLIVICIVFEKVLAVSEISPVSVSQVEEISVGKSDGYGVTLNNLTRCSSTELTLSKESLLYTWEIKGFLNYFIFMKKFGQIFEIKTEEVNFKSDIVDGKWFFKLSKIATSTETEDLVVTTTYSYEAKQPKKLNFHIHLSIIHNEKEIVLPAKKSTNPVVTQQRLYNRRGYSSYLEYVHTFTWTDVGHAIENIIKPSKSETDGIATEEVEASIDGSNIILRFLITSYFPSDPVYTGSENCQTVLENLPGLIRDGDAKTLKKLTNPPYLKHSNSMLHDERFADVVLKLENEEINAHRIILASSSPVFSALLKNDTEAFENDIWISNGTEPPESSVTILIDIDLSKEALMEMLNYIYTGRVNSLERLADKLILAGHKYGLPELKRMCEKILYSKVRPENAIEMYILGHEVASIKIVRRAFSIMKANKSKIASQSEEFRRLTLKHPNLMFELFVS